MSRERWLFAGVLLAIVVGVAALMLAPKVDQALAPELLGARIAIRAPGSEIAVAGPAAVEVASGAEVRLEAVVVAQRRDGSRVYYTEAAALEIDGETIPAERISRWDRPLEARVRWFTIESTRPSISVARQEDLGLLRFEEILRPEWPRGWSIPLVVDPRLDDALDQERRRPPFGTVRLHVRVELLGAEQKLVPVERWVSPGADQLPDHPTEIATVVVTLPGPLAEPSAAFGLAQLDLETSEPAVLAAVDELYDARLAGSIPPLLREELARRGAEPGAPVGQELELGGGRPWGESGVAPGDILRVGARVVFLYRDENGDGRLDLGDSALDFEGGATVRALDAIFAGAGIVEWLPAAANGS